jgi:hypothetical protein
MDFRMPLISLNPRYTQAHSSFRLAGCAARLILALTLALPPLAAQAADEDLRVLVKELAGQVQQLSARVAELERKLEESQARSAPAQPPTASPPTPGSRLAETKNPALDKPRPALPTPAASGSKPVTVGDAKGTFKIPGTDTSLGFGGYVKLDAIYNSVSGGGSGGTNAADQLLQPSKIPLRGQGEHSQVTFSPRESRFWLKSYTPTGWGDLNTFLEVDFYNVQAPGLETVTNSYAPGLRHAYGSLGGFLAGQTWTTFMYAGALPELNDFGGPVGRLFVRQPLVRWTEPWRAAGVDGEFQFALESPESSFLDASACTAQQCAYLTPDDDRAPDIVARLNFNPSWGTLALSGMARQVRIAEGAARHAAWGGSVGLGGRIKGPGLDILSFMAGWGDGLGRYLYNDVFPDAAFDGLGHFQLVEAYGGYLAYQHFWNPAWRSTLAYGQAEASYPWFVPGTATGRVRSVHVNLLWSPLLQTTFGLEYIYALRALEDGEDGDLQRVQFSAKYNF